MSTFNPIPPPGCSAATHDTGGPVTDARRQDEDATALTPFLGSCPRRAGKNHRRPIHGDDGALAMSSKVNTLSQKYWRHLQKSSYQTKGSRSEWLSSATAIGPARLRKWPLGQYMHGAPEYQRGQPISLPEQPDGMMLFVSDPLQSSWSLGWSVVLSTVSLYFNFHLPSSIHCYCQPFFPLSSTSLPCFSHSLSPPMN